jgi:glycerol-3-phosphate dehydrogenase (NAD(P)+)
MRIGVLGAGSWGTALAALATNRGHEVCLWAREPEVVRHIREDGENRLFLPGVELPRELRVTGEMERAVAGADIVMSVSPAQFAGAVVGRAASFLEPQAVVVSASKGIEIATLRRMDEVMAELLKAEQSQRLTVLSGPSFAKEVVCGQPTAVVAASRSEEARLLVQNALQGPTFRVYTNDDVIGVELGGALKNVIALAAGVVAGLDFGHNTLCALITRGLAEITRLGVAMGASRSTFFGLAGMGDLVLTCTGQVSRNRTVGFELGRGRSLGDILDGMTAVAEGVKTAEAVRELAARYRVEMPICQQVYDILMGKTHPAEAANNLMTRDPKPEDWS